MKEAYVSYEVAKLLKERGFDWFTYAYYTKDDVDENPYFGMENLCPDNWNGEVDEVNDLWFSAPTQQMACRWLREEKGIHISADIYKDSSNDADGNVVDEWTYWAWTFYWLPSGNVGDEEGYDQFDSYEDAVEAGLEFVLKNLI